jgi:PPOX class probable F420-dependent enzyme
MLKDVLTSFLIMPRLWLTLMAAMSQTEIRRFLMKDTFTGKLATVREKGGSHVIPIWFFVDDKNRKRGLGDIVFTTGSETTKAKNIRFDKMVSICVDDQTPLFSFVTIFGVAKIMPYKQREVLKWATKIAERYMGKSKAQEYGKRNSGEGEVLVRITPKRIIAEKDIAV